MSNVTVELCCGTKETPPVAVCGECCRLLAEVPPEPRITPAMVDRLAQNVRNQLGWLRISAEDRATTLKTIRNWVRKENARAK